MEYRELIEQEQKGIKSVVYSFDSIFRLKGKISFKRLILDMDNSKLSEADILRRTRAMLEMTLISSRKTNPAVYTMLKDKSYYDSVLTIVRRYSALNDKIYVIDKQDIEYYDELIEDGVLDELQELDNLFINDTETEFHVFNIVCNNKLYYCEIPNLKHENRRNKDEGHLIRLFSPNGDDEKLLEPIYSAYISIESNKGKLDITNKEVNINCACEDCQYFKDSTGKIYKDGSKKTGCSWLMTNKCNEFKYSLKPEELLAAAMSIIYANNHKSDAISISRHNNNNTNRVATLSSTDKDVTVYIKEFYDIIREIRAEDDEKELENTSENKEKTYTSPREHERKGHYVHYKSGKVVFRKGCTVNKGKDKTTYKVKVNKQTKDKYNSKNT